MLFSQIQRCHQGVRIYQELILFPVYIFLLPCRYLCIFQQFDFYLIKGRTLAPGFRRLLWLHLFLKDTEIIWRETVSKTDAMFKLASDFSFLSQNTCQMDNLRKGLLSTGRSQHPTVSLMAVQSYNSTEESDL